MTYYIKHRQGDVNYEVIFCTILVVQNTYDDEETNHHRVMICVSMRNRNCLLRHRRQGRNLAAFLILFSCILRIGLRVFVEKK